MTEPMSNRTLLLKVIVLLPITWPLKVMALAETAIVPVPEARRPPFTPLEWPKLAAPTVLIIKLPDPVIERWAPQIKLKPPLP